MKIKSKEVVVCECCDEHQFLIECRLCGGKYCHNHIKPTVKYWPKLDDGYAPFTEAAFVCSNCQEKPFGEIWDKLLKLGWVAR